MARLGIPALYHLDIGSSEWGWHKMSDLVCAVNNWLDRSRFRRMTAEEIGKEFSYLNPKRFNELCWAEEEAGVIEFSTIGEIDWSKSV